MSKSGFMSRRRWLLHAGATGGAVLLEGCVRSGSSTRPLATPGERRLLAGARGELPIVQYQLGGTNLGSVLRQQAASARPLGQPLLTRLDRLMRASLKRSGGVGLAAPQVGLARRVALVQLQRKTRPVLTCVDPRITRRSADRVDGYEACLSIRGVGGLVPRSRWVELTYYDLGGRQRQRRSTGWEARIFQHELDHLEGRLYVDRVAGPLLPLDEMRRRRRRRSAVTGPEGSPLAQRVALPKDVVLL